MSVTELKKPIYHRARNAYISFKRLTSLKSLNQLEDCNILQRNLDTVHTLVSSARPFPWSKEELHRALIDFYKIYTHLQLKDVITVLHFFKECPQAQKIHKIVLSYYRCVGVFAFEACSNSDLSIYEIQIYRSHLKKSAWIKLGPIVESQILTITSELGIKNKLNLVHVYQWWHKGSRT